MSGAGSGEERRQPAALPLVQAYQPPSNHAQAQPPYRVEHPAEKEADRKIAARREALMVDGKTPQITGWPLVSVPLPRVARVPEQTLLRTLSLLNMAC